MGAQLAAGLLGAGHPGLNDGGYGFVDVVIRANLIVPQEEERERALRLLHKAKGLCLVARSLSVPQKFEPLIAVAGLSPIAAELQH